MIRKLGIRNFQNHRKLDLFLGPVNCLVGPSDCGKSAVLRALIWGLTNRPLGAAFLTNGETSARVTLLIEDDLLVREKGSAENYYELNGDRYVAFAADVPEPVTACVGIGPINIQQQHDPVFWFSDSPGAVSQSLNCIVDLGTIDDTLASLSKTVNGTKAELRVTETRRNDLVGKLAAVQHAQAMFTAFSDLDSLYFGVSAARSQLTKLESLIQGTRQADTTIQQNTLTLTAMKGIAGHAQAAQDCRQRAAKLNNLIQSVRDADNAVGDRPAMPTSISANYDACRAKRGRLRLLRDRITEVLNHDITVAQLQREKDDLCQALPPMPVLCPACNQPIP